MKAATVIDPFVPSKQAIRRVSKYRNIPVVVDGQRFASKAEARHYGELKLREAAGEIRHLECQRRFPLEVNGIPLGSYVADFSYEERSPRGEWIFRVVDVKGVKRGAAWTLFRLKARLMLACHGQEVLVVS